MTGLCNELWNRVVRSIITILSMRIHIHSMMRLPFGKAVQVSNYCARILENMCDLKYVYIAYPKPHSNLLPKDWHRKSSESVAYCKSRPSPTNVSESQGLQKLQYQDWFRIWWLAMSKRGTLMYSGFGNRTPCLTLTNCYWRTTPPFSPALSYTWIKHITSPSHGYYQ